MKLRYREVVLYFSSILVLVLLIYFSVNYINKKPLEINTHPGLTKLSLAPEQANYQSLSYLNLLKQIIRSSL